LSTKNNANKPNHNKIEQSSQATVDSWRKEKILLQWRQDSIRHLYAQGFEDVGFSLRNCGCSFMVDYCPTDITHTPKPVALHCGLRICPDCAQRESYRLLLAYLPKLTELLGENPDYPKYSLKHLVITTPFALRKLTSASFKQMQKLVKIFLETFFFEEFKKLGKLSPDEIRRGRCDLKKHGIGGIQAAEFGERGTKLHWHLLIYAPFMPVKRIWQVWSDVTGGACTNAKIYPLKPSSDQLQYAGGDLLAALKEVAKYSTKFTAIKPRDIPHLHRVLKGNRRFRAFGILYNCQEKATKPTHACDTCSAQRDLITVGTWLNICENLSVPPDNVITAAVDSGIEKYLSRYSSEISSGKSDKPTHKARDSIDGDAYV